MSSAQIRRGRPYSGRPSVPNGIVRSSDAGNGFRRFFLAFSCDAGDGASRDGGGDASASGDASANDSGGATSNRGAISNHCATTIRGASANRPSPNYGGEDDARPNGGDDARPSAGDGACGDAWRRAYASAWPPSASPSGPVWPQEPLLAPACSRRRFVLQPERRRVPSRTRRRQ